MKASILATAAVLAGSAVADGIHMRHEALHQRRAVQGGSGAEPAGEQQQQCGCNTEVITYYGSPSLVPIPQTSSSPAPAPTSSVVTPEPEPLTTISSTSFSTLTVVVTSAPPAVTETASEVVVPSSSSSPAPVEPSTPVESPAPVETPVETPSSAAPVETSTPVETPSTSSVVVQSSATPVAPATSSAAPTVPSTPAAELPTPDVTHFSTTGVYTIPAKTLTVTDSTTVCGATGTEVPSGTHTVGGVTTVVETATTVTCPYATVKPSGTTVTSVIETTSYVCPSAGTYTIAPIVTYVPTSTMLVYPTPATYTPGTYTKPEQTMTVTNTDYTYVCPESSAPAAPSTTPVASSTTPAISISLGVSTASSSATPSSTPSNSPSNVMGMTYSPYSNDGNCKDQAAVLKDVAELAKKGFSHVRVYATDCNGLENVGEAAKQNNLKMIIGVYIDGSGISGAQEQVTAIQKWAQWDLVTLIVVGNEAIQDGFVDVAGLAGLITSAKKTWKAAGYTGDVTTSEPINVWEEKGSGLCSAIDQVGANIHPFFNAQTTADQAGKFARSEVEILEKICPGQDVVILETGWPNNGEANGAAVPGKTQQAAAIKALVEEVGSQSVFFSYSNDEWKDAGEFDVERYWGCIENF